MLIEGPVNFLLVDFLLGELVWFSWFSVFPDILIYCGWLLRGNEMQVPLFMGILEILKTRLLGMLQDKMLMKIAMLFPRYFIFHILIYFFFQFFFPIFVSFLLFHVVKLWCYAHSS